VHRRSQQGFTLIEVLVAVVIVATAGSALLGHMRSLIDYEQRVRQRQELVSALLNQVAKLQTASLAGATLRVEGQSGFLVPADREQPQVRVDNFDPTPGKKVPPLELAYTPYQIYTFTENRKPLGLVLPGMRPPPALGNAAEK
jgi:prepilin-type N-terminal cleavage/methylation domain-containing protein